MTRSPRVLGLLAATLLVGALGGVSPAAAQGLVRLDVTIGKSQIIDLKDPFNRVSVTNPSIADVFAITPTQLLINGKSVGVTSLVVFYPQRTLFFDLVVQTDLGLLTERLKQIAPRDDIQVDAAQDAVILRGTTSADNVIAAATEVAGAFAPKGKVINLITMADVKAQQVMLQVHVAEVNRQAIRELGFSFRFLEQAIHAGVFPGIPFFPGLGNFNTPVEGPNIFVTPDFSLTSRSATGTSGILISSPDRSRGGLIQALESRNLLRTLAKPNLVTHSGKEAKFISGGEFPFPVSQRDNTITIEFKEFGVGLLFTPEVRDGENIDLKVRPEVSSLDFTQGLVATGFRIPVIRKNQAFTNVSLKDGETFAIGGLINNEVRQVVSKIPLLGDIPILGALFRSSEFQNNETELLFLVTVKLVKPAPVGTAGVPDATKLMELRDAEKKEFTLVPGIPGVGEVVDRPFGKSNLPAESGAR